MKKIFITITFTFAINSYAFDDIYLSCANSSIFYSITKSFSQKLSGSNNANVKKADAKRNGFNDAPMERYVNDLEINVGTGMVSSYIDRVSGILYEEIMSPTCELGDYECIADIFKPKPKQYKKIGTCSAITESQAVEGAKRIYRGYTKPKTKF